MPAFEGKKMEYVDFHHLTEIPASIAKWKNRAASIESIEIELHAKLAQRCTTDKHLYNEILRLFKDQYRRAGKDVTQLTGINKHDFHQILTILGLFATKEQADGLFDKYDTNQSGNLSIHEFWVQARPQDYRSLPGFQEKQMVDEMVMNRARKRMYIKESLLHTAVKPPVPPPTVYSLPTERLLAGIRDKIRQNSVVDMTLSAQRTRRYLSKLFEYNDPDGLGWVLEHGLRRVLDHINYAVGDHYIKALVQAFPGPHPETLDYPRLSLAVYPFEVSPIQTSAFGQSSTVVKNRLTAENALSNSLSMTGGFRPHTGGSQTARVHQERDPNRPVSSLARVQQAQPPSRSGSRASGAMTYRGEPRPPPSRSGITPRAPSRGYMAQAATAGAVYA